MGFLQKITSLLGGGAKGEDSGRIHYEYVRCARCGEKIAVRVDLENQLTPQWDEGEGAYYVRKGVIGSGSGGRRCFQTIEVELYFDADRRPLSRYITGGEFITRAEFEASESALGGMRMDGHIPVLMVEGESLAAAWEESLLAVYRRGCDVRTEYDRPGDPPSKDASLVVVVRDPLAEPMIHRALPCGLEDLQEYVLEVLEGIKDHCVRDPADPDDTRWEYTYHQRLFGYAPPGADRLYDQIELLAARLSKTPHSRRAQAITWQVWEDNFCYDPPCLQSIWCRILPNEAGEWVLNMNVRFRSNDAYKAAFMNMFALVQLQAQIAARIAALAGVPEVKLGRYVHQADSYHIYGSYLREFEERFLRALETRTFAQRTFRYADVKPMMDAATPAIRAKAAQMGLNRAPE